MLNRTGKSFFLVFLFISGFHTVKSQDLEVGLTGGGCYYLGDLNPGQHFLKTQMAYGLMARYCLDTRWAVKLSGTRGSVKGDAASSGYLPDRGLSFSSSITDISAVVEFNFLPYFTGSRMNGISPYIYTGISVFFFNPVSNGISLRSIGTEGQNIGYLGRKPYGTTSLAIPFGLGAKFSLGNRLSLQVFWEMHKTFTDYLDDVSTTYYLNGNTLKANDQAGLMSDPTHNHTAGMQRGNEKTNDWYALFGLSFTYKFNLLSSKKCRDLHHN
ncbi:MAG: DUF6089 family protein [Bacteroidota bacterium]